MQEMLLKSLTVMFFVHSIYLITIKTIPSLNTLEVGISLPGINEYYFSTETKMHYKLPNQKGKCLHIDNLKGAL